MEKQNDMLLQVKDLRVYYTAGGEIINAVNGVDLEVRRGETLGLVGETGAGKTTIAKSIMRILPDPPAKIGGGEIYLDGQELLHLPEKKMQEIRGKKISMIFQDPMTALNPVFTVGEQIEEVIMLHEKVNRGEAAVKARQMLELVGIPGDRSGDYPHQFSGGMKQRVVIAMALACSPELILADEPTTALDVTIQAQILDMIKALKEKQNTSMILITHDLGVVAEVCDRVAVVYAGEIIEYGTKEEIFDYPTHPYTVGLFGSIPKIHEDVEWLDSIPGMPPNPADLPSRCHFHPRCSKCTQPCGEKAPEMIEVRPGHFVRCLNCTEKKES
mgnify:FL=1